MQSPDWYPYEFRWLALDSLIVERFDGDQGFQRPESARFVREQVREFDARRFEPLIVAEVERDKEYVLYSVIDGQHRLAIGEQVSLADLPCLVCVGLEYDQRAALFRDLNLRRRYLSLRENARAAHEAREPLQIGLEALLHRHGFFLEGFRPEDANGHRRITALAALKKEYASDPAALNRAIECLHGWRDLHSQYMQGQIIRALCVLARDDGFNPSRMTEIFRRFGPDHFYRDARERAARGNHARPTRKDVVSTFLEHYNRGLRKNKLNVIPA